jgi:hypothetical protein
MLLAKFMDFFLGPKTPLDIFIQPSVPMGTNYQKPHFENMLNTVFYMLKNSRTISYPETNPKLLKIDQS